MKDSSGYGKCQLSRTGSTGLTDDELTILDAIAIRFVESDELCADGFDVWNNWAHTHSLADQALSETLESFLESGIIQRQRFVRTDWVPEAKRNCGIVEAYHLTPLGDELWACERQPVWDRYLTVDRYPGNKGTIISEIWSPRQEPVEALIKETQAKYNAVHLKSPGIVESGLRSSDSGRRFLTGFLAVLDGGDMLSSDEQSDFRERTGYWESFFDVGFSALDRFGPRAPPDPNLGAGASAGR